MTSEWKQEIAGEIAHLIATHQEIQPLLQDSVQKWLGSESHKDLLPLRFGADYTKDEQLIFLAAIHDVYSTAETNRIISLDAPIEQMFNNEKFTKKQRDGAKQEYKRYVRWEKLKLDIKTLPDMCIGDYNYDENYESPDRVTSHNKKTKKQREAAQHEDLARLISIKPMRHKTGEDDVRTDLEFIKFLSTLKKMTNQAKPAGQLNALPEKTRKILRYMAETPTLRHMLIDIEMATDISRKTVSEHLKSLEAQGLVKKYTQGTSLTKAGLQMATEQFPSKPF